MWPILIILTAVLVTFLISPVTMEIKYTYCFYENPLRDGSPCEYVPDRGVRISLLWGLLNLRLKLSSVQLAQRAFTPVLKIRARLSRYRGSTLAREKTSLTPQRAIHLYLKVLRIYRTTAPAYHYLLSKTVLRHFSWRTALGLPEAGQTGMAVGFLWIVKSNATSYLYRKLGHPAPRPELEIVPVFDRLLARISFDCIFSLRTGHIIYTGLLAGWHFLKNRR